MSAVQKPPPSLGSKTAKRFPDRDPQLFYELAKDQLSTQLGSIDAVDNKLGLLFSVSSALMGILVAVFAVRGPAAFHAAEYTIVSISGLVFIATGALTFIAYRGRDWDIGPDLLTVWNDLWDSSQDDDLLKWKVANDFRGYYEENVPLEERKTSFLPWVVLGIIVQTATLCSALGLVAAGG